MIRNLVRIRCCVVFQESNCHGNYHAGSPAALFAPGRQIFSYPPASGSKTTLTRILLCRLFFVVSSLLPHLAYILACFGALCSVSCRSPSLLFGGELDHWLSHGQSGVQGCWCRRRLLRVVLVEGADHLPEGMTAEEGSQVLSSSG